MNAFKGLTLLDSNIFARPSAFGEAVANRREKTEDDLDLKARSVWISVAAPTSGLRRACILFMSPDCSLLVMDQAVYLFYTNLVGIEYIDSRLCP